MIYPRLLIMLNSGNITDNKITPTIIAKIAVNEG